MSTENVKKFYEQVAKDEALRTQIEGMYRQEMGDAPDQARAQQFMEEKVLPLASQMGFDFTIQELSQLAAAGAAAGERELNYEELDAVAGGLSHYYCFIGGFDRYGQTSGGAFCVFFGFKVDVNFSA